ncbi:MAG: DUF domain-containing protein, partial [Bacilli bacterium]|nr:DUF domain-containing protein [Bacilli bacterium]
IEQVGPTNVVQLCTDNAAIMTGAMSSLLEKYPHMYKQGCAAHILDLLLEDWGKSQSIKDLVNDCRTMVKHIRKYQFTLALFRKHSPNKALRLPALTRFATNFLMVDRLVDCKQALQTVVADDSYMTFEFSLQSRTNGRLVMRRAIDVRLNIHPEEFWSRCKNFIFMVEPVLIALRHFDGKKPAMPKAWLVMHDLKKHVYALKDPPFLLDPVVAARYEKQFEARWKLMRTDLHYAGALLNPFLSDVEDIQNDGIAKAALNRVIRKLAPTLEVSIAVAMQELVQFEEKTGPFDPQLEVLAITETNLEPHQWWNHVGGDALPKIAKRIQGLTCSASSCERNWSMYSFVHNKVRNRLTTSKAEDLVYIYANSKLEREKRGYNPALFYEKVLVDGDTEEERDEPIPEESEEEDYIDFIEENANRKAKEERLRDNEWAAMVPPQPSPPRYRYGNTFASGNDVNDAIDDELFRSPEQDRVRVWDGNWSTILSPTAERTPSVHNDDISNSTPACDLHARSPVPVHIPLSTPRTVQNTQEVNLGSEQEEEAAHIQEDVVQEEAPISLPVNALTTRMTEPPEYDSDAPLNTVLHRNRNIPNNQGVRTNQATVRRLAPTSSTRAPMHGGLLLTINEEVPASAPQPTQPTPMSGLGPSSLEERQDNNNNRSRSKGKGRKRRLRRPDERLPKNPRRVNQIVEPYNMGAGSSTQAIQGQSSRERRHPESNIDGTTDALRLTKRIVQTEIPTGQDIQVRNLTSEVEREIHPEPIIREDDENESSSGNRSTDDGYESREDTDPDVDEVRGDSDFRPSN